MSKIRTVKPDLFRHEELFEAELQFKLPLRFVFIGLFTVCDREGRFRWRPRQLKLDILPYDEVDFSLALDALEKSGFIMRYEMNGISYGCIPSWHKHQVINVREAESVIPSPQEALGTEQPSSETTPSSSSLPISIAKLPYDELSMANPSLKDCESIRTPVDTHQPLDKAPHRTSMPVSLIIDPPAPVSTHSNNAEISSPVNISSTFSAPEFVLPPLMVAEQFTKTGNSASSITITDDTDFSSRDISHGGFNKPEALTTHVTESSFTWLNEEAFSELQFNNPLLNSNNYFDSYLDNLCMHVHDRCTHVHAYACTCGNGREMEKERELEKEQEWEEEVRRGREICATQTCPPQLSNSVAQARRRSSDPPEELNACELIPSRALQRAADPKNVKSWKLPTGDPPVKQAHAKNNTPRNLVGLLTQARGPQCDPPEKRSACKADPPSQEQGEVITGIFNYWKLALGHPQAKLDPSRKKIISRALKLGYSKEELREAITGCSYTPHNVGDNERGIRYDGLQLILRDADHIDRFIHTCRHPPRSRSPGEKLTEANLSAAVRWLQHSKAGGKGHERSG